VTTIRVVAAHDVVAAAFPRPVTEADEVGLATGKAIDGAVAQWSHAASTGARPTMTAVRRWAEETLDEELRDAHHPIAPAERDRILTEVAGVLSAFRKSELYGLPRPRSRLLLVTEACGVYAQPDFWNRTDRFYEMKSYRPTPIPPAIQLQVRLFQLAFPRFEAILACFDRHHPPVTAELVPVPAPTPAEARAAVDLVAQVALASGRERVLEYIDAPIVRYTPGT